MSMTWGKIAKEPKSKHNALIKLYTKDLTEQCWDEHEQKSKVDNRASDDFLENVNGGENSIFTKGELDRAVEKFVAAIKG